MSISALREIIRTHKIKRIYEQVIKKASNRLCIS